jgi:predicted enzyme related to lactoylglutathione lyase
MMADAKTPPEGAPVWVDLSSTDPAASRAYYAKLFSWEVEVVPDPEAGGYALATSGGKNVAGIGPTQSADGPSAWMVYVGTKDAEATAKKVEAAGGKVVAPPFDVMGTGRMAVFQDPIGAFISVWEPHQMKGADVMNQPNAFSWAELNARGIEKAKPFYSKVFGWGLKESPMGEGAPPYTEFKIGEQSIAGGMEMDPRVPAVVPPHWLVYFGADNVDEAFRKAVSSGGRGLMEPMDFPGGRFAVVSDPQGANFGLLKMDPR